MPFSFLYEDQHYSTQQLLESNSSDPALAFSKQWLSNTDSFIVNTSGSTGTPKPITLKREQILASIRQTQTALSLAEGDSCLINLSCDHIAGKLMLARGFEIGMNITVMEACRNPLKAFSHHFDFYSFVPLQLEAIINESPEVISYLNKAKAIIIGGAPMSDQLITQVNNLITAPVYTTFGMTETVTHIALKKMNTLSPDPYFKTLDGIQIETNKDNGLKIRGEVTNNEWIETNDIVELKKDGFQWIGRRDNIINSGGIKIQIEPLEADIKGILYNAGLQVDLFVFAKEDDHLGQCVALAIASKNEIDLSELFKDNLVKYSIPKIVYWLESFKYTSSNKIDRRSTIKLLRL